MKKLFYLALSVLSVSCANDVHETNSKTELAINAYIGNGSTRAVSEKQDWQEDDVLGVFVCNGTIDKPYLGDADRYVNVAYRHNGKGFVAQSIYLDEHPAEVFAYFPYSAVSTAGNAVPVESTTQTDYLYGHSETPASISQKNVNIEMKHALSQVVFKIRRAADYNEGVGELSGIKIENNDETNTFKTAGTLDLSTGMLTGTSVRGTLNLMPSGSIQLTGEYQSVSSICLPVSSTPGKNIRVIFTIDQREFKFEFPAGTTWNSGTRNIYTLTLKNTGLEIGGGGSDDDSGITIESWGDSSDNDISLVPIL